MKMWRKDQRTATKLSPPGSQANSEPTVMRVTMVKLCGSLNKYYMNLRKGLVDWSQELMGWKGDKHSRG